MKMPLKLRRYGTLGLAVAMACATAVQLSTVVAHLLPFQVTSRFDAAELFLIATAVTMVTPAVRCANALGRRQTDPGYVGFDIPTPICLSALVGALIAWYPWLIQPTFGSQTHLVVGLALWFGSVTVLAFFAAGACVEVENDGEKPGTVLNTILYHLGGYFGILFARIVFKGSPAFKDMPVGFPKIVGAFACIAVAAGFSGMKTIPAWQSGRHALVAPNQALWPPK